MGRRSLTQDRLAPVMIAPHPARLGLCALLAVLPACRTDAPVPQAGPDTSEADVAHAFEAATRRIEAHADSLDALLHPVSLLRASEQAALRRFSNEEQLVVARRLGVTPPDDPAGLQRLRAAGRLVPLDSSTALWVVRELDHSVALVTPGAKALLTELATRFQARLRDLGLPALRLEVTSALRTSESQADLRRTNRNATSGTSTHEFGTTFDVAYSGFRAPEALTLDLPESPWLAPHLRRYATVRIETIAARRSRELQAILGRVLRQMQAEGRVMVTLEEQQPVYHMTVARRL
jgi:hypothetical protein